MKWVSGHSGDSAVTLLGDWPPLSALERGRLLTAPAVAPVSRLHGENSSDNVLSGPNLRIRNVCNSTGEVARFAAGRLTKKSCQEGLESCQIQRGSRNTVADSGTAAAAARCPQSSVQGDRKQNQDHTV